MTGIVPGAGAYRYEVDDPWARLPPGREFDADVAAVGVRARDRVYAFNRGAHPVVVLDREGNFSYTNREGRGPIPPGLRSPQQLAKIPRGQEAPCPSP